MIEVKNLVKRYGNHTAVDQLSFTVDKGQIMGFLGPNGAGKSTTMNIITGYISATEGTVTVNGLDVFEEPEEVKKMIGYLPEFPPLYPDMTVYEYLDFVADIKKVKKSEKKQMIADIMEATMITTMSDRLIKHLSKGYKQRVGLAQAIMGYPELIILDEPTVGLDPKQIIEIRELIKQLAKNHTVILSSHIMQEVSAVCDTIMIIDKGKLILSDKPENLSARLGATGGLKLMVKGDLSKVKAALNKISRIKRLEEHQMEGKVPMEGKHPKEGNHQMEDKLSGEDKLPMEHNVPKEHKVPLEDEGIVKLTVYCDDNEDIREEVFYAMCEAKTPILEMQSLRMSLEDIFLKVTGQDAKQILEEPASQDEHMVKEPASPAGDTGKQDYMDNEGLKGRQDPQKTSTGVSKMEEGNADAGDL